SASNDSLVVDAQAYGIRNPSITIEYQQPLAEDTSLEEISGNGSSGAYRILFVMGAISALVLVTGSAFVFMMRKRRKDRETGENDTHKAGRPLGAELPDVSNSIETTRSFQDVFNSGSNRFVDNSKEEAEPGEVLSMTSLPEDMLGDKMMARAIVVGSELNAVLETLTPRERSIMETLIKHGGRMTQMDMRYETGVPKSTLTMVLISLEKRNLVTRKEYGRTNVIELSERFFSGEKHS
ncbi:MAG: hypothetical protein WA106_06890, partial [Methanothrix sp.]